MSVRQGRPRFPTRRTWLLRCCSPRRRQPSCQRQCPHCCLRRHTQRGSGSAPHRGRPWLSDVLFSSSDTPPIYLVAEVVLGMTIMSNRENRMPRFRCGLIVTLLGSPWLAEQGFHDCTPFPCLRFRLSAGSAREETACAAVLCPATARHAEAMTSLWVRSPGRVRRTQPPAAGSQAPRPPVRRALGGGSARTRARDDHSGAVILLQAPHRTQPRLEPAVISLHPVVGVPLGAMPG